MIRHRDSSPARRIVLAAALSTGLAGPAAAAPADLAIWPHTPATPTAEAEAAARSAGQQPRDLADVRARLLRDDEADRAAARAALADVERDLAAARMDFLAQRYDAMLATLERAESAAVLALPAGPACTATLWEIEFQLGLAYASRRQPGDDERARARFVLALALDPARRPLAALYGPDIVLAFVHAVDAAARTPERPLALALTPPDAAVTLDCRPLPAQLVARPGLHLVRADAPGFATIARPESPTDTLTLTLAPDPASLGPWWARGALDPASPSARAAVHAATASARVVWLAAVDAGFVAHLLLGGQVRRIARADTAAAAVARALDEPRSTPAPVPSDRPQRRRTGLWLGLAGAAAGSLALGLGLGLGLRDPSPARLQVVVP